MASTHSMLLKSLADDHQSDDQTQKLEEFMSHLQQERVKIEAFKRELPLCMHLLTNAMEESKKQLQSCKDSEAPRPPVLEEFIPINNNNNNNNNNNITSSSEKVDKSHWMTSVQLWNPSSATCNAVEDNKHTIMGQSNYGDPAAAFLPFGAPEFALAPVNQEISGMMKCSEAEAVADSNGVRRESHSCRMNQANRKTRRCWSPDLHRRFLNALQMLGGSEVATPKQIRELMKVDGLTNDEVKSHLQKYRLHTRRPGPSSMAADGSAPPTQLVVLGGIWVPPEYAAPPMIYGAHPTAHASSHYCVSTAAPQEFYPVSTAAASSHHQLMHQFHVYQASSSSHGSLDSDTKAAAAAAAAGGKSESAEDGKSKRLAALRMVKGEQSNGCEITLKF